jgi:CMP-2-keto-3-deoxyoctulosonic acid synthetase
MPDISRMPQIDSLEAGQQTIQVVAGRIRPGPKVKVLAPLSIPHPILVPGWRHYENNLVRQFADIHAESIALNPDDPDIALTRKSYTRELKLAAIQYATTTLVTNKKGITRLITIYTAAKNLKITYQMMKKWIQKKDEILEQRRVLGVELEAIYKKAKSMRWR